MKLKTLALCALAAAFVSCGKPTVDQQIDKLEKAYKSKDCDKIYDAYAELMYNSAEFWAMSMYNGEKDARFMTPEQDQRLNDIKAKYQDDCDCDFKSLEQDMIQLFFQHAEEVEQQLKQKQEK